MYKSRRKTPRLCDRERLMELTPTEKKVLVHVGHGFNNREIALKLCVQTRTIEHHMLSLYSKTLSRNRAELIVWSMQQGLVEVPGFKEIDSTNIYREIEQLKDRINQLEQQLVNWQPLLKQIKKIVDLLKTFLV
jgi:DNA-binding CsgD family transcriptional regulator